MRAEPLAESTTVKIPKALQVQMEKAEAIKAKMEEEFNRKPKEDEPAPEGPVEIKQEMQPEAIDTPETVEEKPVDTSKKEKPKPDNTAKYWEHRFKTAQGMYEADKTRLKGTIEDLNTRLKELEEKLRTAPRVNPELPDIEEYLSKEEIDAYGPDTLRAVIKVASNAAKEASERAYAERVNQELKPLQTKLEDTETKLRQQVEDNFWDNLNKAVPNWVEVNEDPTWLEWLSEKDPTSGILRQHLLNDAQKTLDSYRVAALFSAFLQNSPALKRQPDVTNRVVPDPVAAPEDTSRASNIQPLTRKEIKQFFTDEALGYYKSRPQARDKMYERIRAAQESGSIR